ncbi:MAG: sulfotransferase family 2 domain-containing protein [Marinicellaceae bacterium]
MTKYNNHVFIGTHIPKTAGSSLISHFKNHIGFKNLHITTSLLENANLDIKFLEESYNNDIIKLVFGHYVDEKTLSNFEHRKLYFFTYIRDPFERLISHYFFDKKIRQEQQRTIINFDKFYQFQQNNSLCKWLIEKFPSAIEETNESLYQQAISILTIFNFVGSTNDFDKKSKILFKDMGINETLSTRQNVSLYNDEKNEISNQFKDQFIHENQDDIKLFEQYKQQHEIKNPYGFNQKKQIEFIYKIWAEEKSNNQLIIKYQNAFEEYQNFNIEEREIKRSLRNVELALLKCNTFINENNDEESKKALIEILQKFKSDNYNKQPNLIERILSKFYK